MLVEPQPDLAERLRAERKARVFACACSSPANAGHTLPLHVAGPLSSLDRSGMAPSAMPEKTMEVPIRTLDDILAEAAAPQGFDFLSIDVEGHELEVLRGFDFARWRPRLILLEDHVADLAKHRYLTCCGYRIVRRYENNGWYVPADADVPNFSRWEILRKYYLALPIRMLRNLSRRLRGKITSRMQAVGSVSTFKWPRFLWEVSPLSLLGSRPGFPLSGCAANRLFASMCTIAGRPAYCKIRSA